MIRYGGLRFQAGGQGQQWEGLLMEGVLLARDVRITPMISGIRRLGNSLTNHIRSLYLDV
jgi:hypothetical protein